ncbi:MAG: hypothetical protein ACRD5K_17310 [Candidatus Acidiferrales bacterium]
MAWTVQIPEDSIDVNLEAGIASLRFRDMPIKDYITLPNSFDLGGLIPGSPLDAVMSLEIEWRGRVRDLGIYRSQTLGFTDHLIEIDRVIVAASVTEDSCAPGSHTSFSFTTEPTSFVNTFSVIGKERNGRFAPNHHGM